MSRPDCKLGPVLVGDQWVADGIRPGSALGRRWTFTAERWTEKSYLTIDGPRVYLSFVQARERGRGYLRELVAALEREGRIVAIPSPILDMPKILAHWGFVSCDEWSAAHGAFADVWGRP